MALVYYPDDRPGITRRRHGRGFTYRGPDGTTIARGAERTRLEAMAVPPAYDRVWMTPLDNGHLMATGYDARARKQYRYHPDWSAAKAAEKFAALPAFGETLPRIRGRISRDLNNREAGDERFALAAALLPGLHEVAEAGEFALETQFDRADRTVTLLADNHLTDIHGAAAFFLPGGIFLVIFHRWFFAAQVIFFTIHEHHHIRILFDRTGFTQVGKLRFFIIALFDLTRQL